jgi:hypothetical protein
LERAAVAAPFDGMPLNSTGYGHRDMRTFRELALMPGQLTYPVADHPCDRSPILWIAFRHALLRVPLPSPRLTDHCVNPHRPERAAARRTRLSAGGGGNQLRTDDFAPGAGSSARGTKAQVNEVSMQRVAL